MAQMITRPVRAFHAQLSSRRDARSNCRVQSDATRVSRALAAAHALAAAGDPACAAPDRGQAHPLRSVLAGRAPHQRILEVFQNALQGHTQNVISLPMSVRCRVLLRVWLRADSDWHRPALAPQLRSWETLLAVRDRDCTLWMRLQKSSTVASCRGMMTGSL